MCCGYNDPDIKKNALHNSNNVNYNIEMHETLNELLRIQANAIIRFHPKRN